jgi:uncharacterized metal-binding protein
VNFVLGFPIAYFGFYHQNLVPPELIVLATASFIVGTLLLSPDLDLRHSIPTRNWGILSIIWCGYSKLFRHRGKSHSLLFSCVTKVIYLLFVAALLVGIYSFLKSIYESNDLATCIENTLETVRRCTEVALDNFDEYKNYWISILAGIVLSDWIHIFTDRIYSGFKRI